MVLTHVCCLLASPGMQLPDAVLGYCGQYYSTRRVAGTIPAPRRPGKFPASCRGARAPSYYSSVHPAEASCPVACPPFCLGGSKAISGVTTHLHARNNHRRSLRDRRRFLSRPPSQIDIVGAISVYIHTTRLKLNVTYTWLLRDGGFVLFVPFINIRSCFVRRPPSLCPPPTRLPHIYTRPSSLFPSFGDSLANGFRGCRVSFNTHITSSFGSSDPNRLAS
eukprot:SAG11_NODE_1640_length_4530_cov_4.604106_1_plen_221_part_00